MHSNDLDIVTGFHVEDQDRHIVILEGLHWKALHRIWDEMPHHTSQGMALDTSCPMQANIAPILMFH